MTITPIADGIYVVDDGTRRWTVAAAGPPEARWVSVDGIVGQVNITLDVPKLGRGSGERRREMSAPMPATVVKILVEPGQAVKAGDTVVVLEAMKMELPIRAAKDGRVKAILCRAGDLVQPGVDLIELE
jgi:3-methylcrotonyl-CoA carboxylase alpha subunit